MTRATNGATPTQQTAPPGAWPGPPQRRHPVRDGGDSSWTWQRDAACRDLGSSLFFGPDGERAATRRRREAAAKAICARCPVQLPCALFALATRQPYGVWGGLTEGNRHPVPEERRRTAVLCRRLHRIRR
jgi:WhiB family transcriptional regulator, redox-sensing transcriptional regulator